MPGYVVLVKFTQQGLSSIKEDPERTRQNKALAEKMGIRTVGVWTTFGEYDRVVVFDAPDDQTLATLMLAAGSQGGMTTTTMRAFSEDEFSQIVSKLP